MRVTASVGRRAAVASASARLGLRFASQSTTQQRSAARVAGANFGSGRAASASFAAAAALAGAVAASTVATYALKSRPEEVPVALAQQTREPSLEERVSADIIAILDNTPEDYDDGSYGPLFVRLAWHASGTYDPKTGTGGSDGATMRFKPESGDGANAGLQLARDLLEPVFKKYDGDMSRADIWILAGTLAISEAGGPEIPFRTGRVDAKETFHAIPPNGRLPDAAQGAKHIRDVFGRYGLTDTQIVALIGAHAMGRCHTDRSGFDGPWTNSPTMFSNDFYVQLLERTWVKKSWNGPDQFEDKESGELMMLPSDVALLDDPKLRQAVERFARDEDLFFRQFSDAWVILTENGVEAFK
jgi:cytochrome c peroxidase